MRDSKDDFNCPLCGCRLIWLPVSHIFVCESCEQSFNEKAEAYLRHQTKSPVGNAAAMRDALESACNWCLNRLGNASYQVTVEGLLSTINAALSAPPRNCDVGTAEEQYRRYWEMCSAKDVNQCAYCEFRKTSNLNCSRDKCFATWAQMPYEAEEGGAE